MQLQVQDPNLQSMFGQSSLYNTLYGGQMLDQANANAAQNLGQAQQEQQFQAQNQPYNLQQLQANVGHTNAMTDLANAQVPGMQAESTIKGLNANAESSLDPQMRADAVRKKLAANMSVDDYQSAYNHLVTQSMSNDPQTSSAAQTALSHMPQVALEMMKLRQEGANAAEVAGINQKTQFGVQDKQIAAGRYDRNKSSWAITQGLAGGFDKQAGAWTLLAQQEQQAAADPSLSDQERQEHLQNATQAAAKARDAAEMFIKGKAAAGVTANGRAPDLNTMGIPTVSNPGSLPNLSLPQGMANPNGTGNPTPGPDQNENGTTMMTDTNGVKHLVPNQNVGKAKARGWK